MADEAADHTERAEQPERSARNDQTEQPEQSEPNERQLNFSDVETILCFHGPLLYEAKIIKAEFWSPGDSDSGEVGPHYFVHYKGWKNTWDEWVPEARVLKLNEENRDRQRQLKALYSQKKKPMLQKLAPPIVSPKAAPVKQDIQDAKAKKGAVKRAAETAQAEVPSQKRSRRSTRGESGPSEADQGELGQDEAGAAVEAVEADESGKAVHADDALGQVDEGQETEEVDFMNRPEIQVIIPDSLKARLIDDWEHIVFKGELVPLPRSPTVIEILDQYVAEKEKTVQAKGESADIYVEVRQGILTYFERCLATMLLYSVERQQLADVRAKYEGKDFVQIYGAEHLLRLFVELPQLLAHTNVDESTATALVAHLAEFTRFLEKNDKFFTNEYEATIIATPAAKPKKLIEKRTGGWNNNSAGLSCANCGTTDTPGWRAGESPEQKLCNACGLYFAKYKMHRPSELWRVVRASPQKGS